MDYLVDPIALRRLIEMQPPQGFLEADWPVALRRRISRRIVTIVIDGMNAGQGRRNIET